MTYESELLHAVDMAGDVQAGWLYQRGMTADLYLPQEQMPEKLPERRLSAETVLRWQLGEWLELVASMAPGSRQRPAAQLLELADLLVYSLNYPVMMRQAQNPHSPTFSLEQSAQAQQQLAQLRLQSETEPINIHSSFRARPDQLRQWLAELGAEVVSTHCELLGYHPNGSVIAEVQRRPIDQAMQKAVGEIMKASSDRTLDKSHEKAIIDQILQTSQVLASQTLANFDTKFFYQLTQTMDAVARTIFGYPSIALQAGILAVDTTVLHPQTQEEVHVRGKNTRNYPRPGTTHLTMAEVRAIRNQFPNSMIPEDFKLGKETVKQYRQRRGLQRITQLRADVEEVRHLPSTPAATLLR